MNGLAKTLLAFLVCAGTALAGGKPTVKAVFASGDVPLNTDASTAFWRSAGIASLEKDTQGKDVPNFHGEVRMRWTQGQSLLSIHLSLRRALSEACTNHPPGDERTVELGCGRGLHQRELPRHQTLQGIRSLTSRRVGRPGYRSTQAAS